LYDRGMRARAILTLAAVVALLVAAAPAIATGHREGIRFLGQAIVPTGTTFGGTTVGGLSSITYDSRLGVFYALSDDASVLQPTRFYTVGLDVRDGRSPMRPRAWTPKGLR
jgi:hypothetical protein